MPIKKRGLGEMNSYDSFTCDTYLSKDHFNDPQTAFYVDKEIRYSQAEKSYHSKQKDQNVFRGVIISATKGSTAGGKDWPDTRVEFRLNSKRNDNNKYYSCVVRIPELHAGLPDPCDKTVPQDVRIQSAWSHPYYTCEQPVSFTKWKPKPGDIVWVRFEHGGDVKRGGLITGKCGDSGGAGACSTVRVAPEERQERQNTQTAQVAPGSTSDDTIGWLSGNLGRKSSSCGTTFAERRQHFLRSLRAAMERQCEADASGWYCQLKDIKCGNNFDGMDLLIAGLGGNAHSESSYRFDAQGDQRASNGTQCPYFGKTYKVPGTNRREKVNAPGAAGSFCASASGQPTTTTNKKKGGPCPAGSDTKKGVAYTDAYLKSGSNSNLRKSTRGSAGHWMCKSWHAGNALTYPSGQSTGTGTALQYYSSFGYWQYQVAAGNSRGLGYGAMGNAYLFDSGVKDTSAKTWAYQAGSPYHQMEYMVDSMGKNKRFMKSSTAIIKGGASCEQKAYLLAKDFEQKIERSWDNGHNRGLNAKKMLSNMNEDKRADWNVEGTNLNYREAHYGADTWDEAWAFLKDEERQHFVNKNNPVNGRPAQEPAGQKHCIRGSRGALAADRRDYGSKNLPGVTSE